MLLVAAAGTVAAAAGHPAAASMAAAVGLEAQTMMGIGAAVALKGHTQGQHLGIGMGLMTDPLAVGDGLSCCEGGCDASTGSSSRCKGGGVGWM